MNRATFLWLLSLLCILAFLGLEPLLAYPIFGSDTGEYYTLTTALATTGHLPLGSYGGWGAGYQDFPGTFVMAAATSGATGVDPLTALQVTIPLLGVLSALPLFLLFRRLFAQDLVALFGAGLATVVMPRLFSLAHPAPLALGDLLVVGGLWMFVEGRRDRRWYLPLSLTAAALVVTHHLSSYFFLVSALAGLLLLELVRPTRWSARFPTRELAFLAAFLVGLVAYWFGYATDFLDRVLQSPWDHMGPGGTVGLALGGVLLLVALGALIRWRRALPARRPWRGPRLPSDRSVLRDFAILGLGVAVGASALILIDLPGTTQAASGMAVVYYLPLVAMIAFAAGSRRLVFFAREGPFALTWLAAVGLSAAAALAANNATLSPTRHAEYLLIPLGLLVAVAVGRLVARLGDAAGRRGLVAGGTAAILLLAANAAIAYPPPAELAGFSEGLTNQDAALWGWIGLGVPPSAVVASDHRVSSMVFGFDGNPATWDSTLSLFVGNDSTAATVELHGSDAPHTLRAINAVALDATMYGGVALDPGATALPLSTAAQQWLGEPPFVPVYLNGAQAVYWVDASEGPVG